MLEQDYTVTGLTGQKFTVTNVSGATYYAYEVDQNAAGAAQQEILSNNDGSHTILGFVPGQTLNSIGNDVMTGGGANALFVLHPAFGHDLITDFGVNLSGAGHDMIQFSSTEFASIPSLLLNTADVAGNAVITAANGDVLTLAGVTKAQVVANSGDFTLV